MTKNQKDSCPNCEYCDNMTEFEQYMAKKWGTPKGVATILLSLSITLLSLGVFLWLLHLANIIK